MVDLRYQKKVKALKEYQSNIRQIEGDHDKMWSKVNERMRSNKKCELWDLKLKNNL